MAKVTAGVYPINVNAIKINTAAAGATAPTWSPIAELEEATLTIDNTTQEWISFESGGWGSALVTAKKSKLTLKGKRSIGDTGNDFLAAKLLEIGTGSYVGIKIERADGSSITWDKMACAVTNAGDGGKAEDVAPLEADLTGHGKPTYSDGTTSGGGP